MLYIKNLNYIKIFILSLILLLLISSVNAKNYPINNKSLWNKNTFNYLAIGNSVTVHGICDYWWDNRGMAATSAEKDYYHIVVKHLQKKHGKITSYPLNFGIWEISSNNRSTTFYVLDKYLSPEINLITIQLGENATNLTTFEKDFNHLITYIKSKSPNARIIIVGDIWKYKNRDALKMNVAKSEKVEFVSLKKFNNNKDYRSKLNSIVYDKKGKEHIIKHKGVADHPNDKAMEYIANNVIKLL